MEVVAKDPARRAHRGLGVGCVEPAYEVGADRCPDLL